MINNSREIIRKAIEKSNLPKNKYNFALHLDTEELSGIPGDKTAYDVGNEPEKHNFDHHD